MSGSNPGSLSGIPIKVIGAPPVTARWHWKRRAAQAAAIILAVLIPASGLLRIDPEAGAFVILGRQIWFADFFLMTGLWVTAVSGLVMLYSTAGTVFCGWACPQNTLAEWANNMTRKLLGKRAEVSLNGAKVQIAAAKNKLLNWLLLGGAFLVAAMLFGLIPLFYFYPPGLVWSFITFRQDDHLAHSLHWIYAVSVIILFLDIALLRHFWCRFSCIYRVWQHMFRTRQTLHVTYDADRAEECAKCNYCVTTCFIDLDPRKTDVYDSCINCGECIDACNRLHMKDGTSGLLRFELGEREQKRKNQFRTAATSWFARARWVAGLAVFGVSMLIWGVWTYQPYHVAAYRAEKQQQVEAIQDYRIFVANKLYRPAQFTVRVQGLPAGSYQLSEDEVKLATAGRESLILSIKPNLPHGMYSFTVEVTSADGWTDRVQMQHFSG
ncbi:MAG: 4Fe-4S binding protein [Gallionellaceae bacterium]|jgi:polyferredoxin|nr:4Fe-4S binding protein [Gallionellaceae bacterium]